MSSNNTVLGVPAIACCVLVIAIAVHGQVCEPAPDGFGCVPLACSDIPEEQCIATVLHLDWATGAIIAVSCECMNFSLCHIEFGDASPFPAGYCPEGHACEVLAWDTDGDGIDDHFAAECIPGEMGACCMDISDGPIPYESCDDSTQEVCEASGWLFHPDTSCEQLQACCFGPDFCHDLNPFCCVDSGGTPQGPATSCSDLVCGGVCAATRLLSNPAGSYCPQVPQAVHILLTPPAGTTIVALEDEPPDGWVVANISHEGSFDPVNWKVKWGPFFAPSIPTAVSYDVIPPNDAGGLACFAGSVSVDGLNEQVCGDACVDLACPPFMEVDLPQPPCPPCENGDPAGCPDHGYRDGRISLCELIGYACAWKVGCNDDLAGMARAAYIWRNGECYCWDDAAENWFPTTCPPPDSLLCDAAGGAVSGQQSAFSRGVAGSSPGGTATVRVRGLRGSRSIETPVVQVAVLIEAPEGGSVMALEFDIPRGWKVRAMSDEGAWDALHRKIKWGPFFEDLSRTVTFELVRGGDRAMSRPQRSTPTGLLNGLVGRVSFDGVIQPITVSG